MNDLRHGDNIFKLTCSIQLMNRLGFGFGMISIIIAMLIVLDITETPIIDPALDKVNPVIAQYINYMAIMIRLVIFDGPLYVLEKTSYIGAFILMTMESASFPVPSELILPYEGYLSFLGYMNLTLVILVSTAASLLGSLIDYWIGRIAGRPLVLRIGKYLGIREQELARAEHWFNTRGKISILIARFIPGLRSIISIPAGIANMDIREFMLYTFIGSIIWIISLTVMGYYLGQKWSLISNIFKLGDTYIIIAIILATLAVIIMQVKKTRA